MGEDDEERSDEEACGEEIDTQELDITTLEDRLGDEVSLDDLPDPASLSNIGLAEDIIDPEIPFWMRDIDPPIGSRIDAAPIWNEVDLPPWVGGIDLPPGLESMVTGSTLEKPLWEDIDTTGISGWGTESIHEEIDTLGVGGFDFPPGFESILKQSSFGQPAWEDIDVPPGFVEIDTALLAGIGATSGITDNSPVSEFGWMNESLWLRDTPLDSNSLDIPPAVASLTETGLGDSYASSVFEAAIVSPNIESGSRAGYGSGSFSSTTSTRSRPSSVSNETGAGELESEIEAYLQRVQAQVSFRRTYSALETYGEKIDRRVLAFAAAQLLNTAPTLVAGPPGIVLSVIGSGVAIVVFLQTGSDDEQEE